MFRLTTLYMNNKSISSYVSLSIYYVRDVLHTLLHFLLTVVLRDDISHLPDEETGFQRGYMA